MLSDTELIRKLDFFKSLDQKIIKQIASVCIVREFSAGEPIVRQGESGLGLYFITGGRVNVEIEKDGSKIVVAELKEGDFLGEFALIDDKTRSASVICLEDTRCLLLTRDSFSKMQRKHPEIANQMLRTLVGRIRSTNVRVTQPVGSPPAPTPATAPAPVTPNGSSAAASTTTGGLEAATDRIVEFIPKAEDVAQFYSSTKGKTQEFLNGLFGKIYGMKAMMRFSMAIVGCPVTVRAVNRNPEVLETCFHGVKLVLFPAGSDQTLRIQGTGDGELSATVFRPRRSARR